MINIIKNPHDKLFKETMSDVEFIMDKKKWMWD